MTKKLIERVKEINKEKEHNIRCDHIDEKMQPIIETLLDKGIITYSCCEGHYEDSHPQVLLLTEINNEIIEVASKLKNFDLFISRGNFLNPRKRISISRAFSVEDITKEEFQEIKSKLLKQLEDMAKQLEGVVK